MEEIIFKETVQEIGKNSLFPPVKNNNLEEILDAQKNGAVVNAICLPSMTFDKVLTEAIKGVEHYEMRCLWEISRVKNKNVNVHFFSKRRVHPDAIKHYANVFNFSAEELARVNFYSVEEILGTTFLPEDLSDYIKDDELVAKEFKKICSLKNAYLECFVLTEKEKCLVDSYDIPSWWHHSDLNYYKTKSGNRKILRGVTPIPRGVENLYSLEESIYALESLFEKTKSHRYVIKLNDGVSGDGNGFIHLKNGRQGAREALEKIKFVSPKMTTEKFFNEIKRIGGVIEEYIEGEDKRSPSVQVLLLPDGQYEILSSHEQVLDESGSRFLGSEFPAKEDHRVIITREAVKVAKRLSTLKLSGIVGLDFLTVKKTGGDIESYLIEMNIRKGGTTHPYWTARTALNARTCSKRGTLVKGEREWVYRSNDNLNNLNNGKRSLSDLIKKVNKAGLIFCPKKKTGLIFHMLSCWEPEGKCGATFIGRTEKEVISLEESLIKLMS